MLRDIEVQDAPTVVTDDEEAVEHTEGGRWDREEIHCSDNFPMISKEGEPTFGWLGIPRRSFHPAGDRSLRDIKAKHKEFAMDARGTPRSVLGDHPEDQLPNLLRRLFSPNLRPDLGDQPPIQAESDSVPSHDRFRVHYDEGSFPSRPESAHENPEEFVEYPKSWPRALSLQDSKLLPKN